MRTGGVKTDDIRTKEKIKTSKNSFSKNLVQKFVKTTFVFPPDVSDLRRFLEKNLLVFSLAR